MPEIDKFQNAYLEADETVEPGQTAPAADNVKSPKQETPGEGCDGIGEPTTTPGGSRSTRKTPSNARGGFLSVLGAAPLDGEGADDADRGAGGPLGIRQLTVCSWALQRPADRPARETISWERPPPAMHFRDSGTIRWAPN